MMEGYFQLKLKRKDLEDVSDDFSDFSLSSPARKMRRLVVVDALISQNAELSPIIEEEEGEVPVTVEQSDLQEQRSSSNESRGLRIEEIPSVPENDERAIVLFKPSTTTPLLQSPFNFSVNPCLISGLKDQVLWSSRSNSRRTVDDEAGTRDGNLSSDSEGLAVVPSVTPQFPSDDSDHRAEFLSQNDNCETMNTEEELGEATMEVEDSTSIEHSNANEAGGIVLSDSMQQWQQQQHYKIAQLPHNMTTPIFWY